MKKSTSATRAVALGMAVVLAAGLLSGCGKKKNGGSEGLSEYVYVPHYTELPEEISDIGYAYLFEDMVYFSSNVPVRSNGEILSKAEIEKWQSEMDAYYSQFKEGEALPAPAVEGEMAAAEETVNEETEATDSAVMPEMPADYSDITYKTFLFAMNKDGSNYHKLEKYVPIEVDPSLNSYANMDRLVVDGQGNLWISETKTTTIFDLPEDFNPETQNQWDFYKDEAVESYIRKLSPEGEELASVDLSQYYVKPEGQEDYRGRFYVNDMQADKAGNLYVSDGQTIYVLDANATFLFKLSSDEWFSNFIGIKSGEMGIAQGAMKPDGTYGNVLKTIDLTTKGWGEKEYNVPNNIWQTSAGGDKYDFCYTDSSSLFGYNLETGTTEKVLSWLNSDVNGDSILFSTIQPDGNVFAISREWGRGDSSEVFEVIELVRTPRSEVPQKHILTLATIWTDYNLKKQILKFNKTNPDYRIEVFDYSEFNSDGDYNAGTTKLNTEIISGKIPDMISLNNLPYRQYAAKGLLEDLYPFLDADTQLGGREALVPGILKALETEGKLYQIATGFSAISIVGKPSVVGTEMGWTMSELRQIVEDHPEADVPFGMHMNRANLMQMFTMLSIDKYIDWQKGTCSFNSEDFKQLLSFVKTFPETDESMQEDGNWIDPSALIQEGRQLFEMFDVSDFDNYQYYKATFGGEIAFKGMPAEDGDAGSVASLMGSLAMTSSCSDKEGAWQFMRMLLDEEFQTNEIWNLPINQKAFDKKLAEAMKQEYYTDENGNKVPQSKGGMSMGDGEMVELYALTQEEADQIMAVINSITRTFSYDESILNIINEEAEFFFKGEKTVDQTADIIQSRMTIFINEQR